MLTWWTYLRDLFFSSRATLSPTLDTRLNSNWTSAAKLKAYRVTRPSNPQVLLLASCVPFSFFLILEYQINLWKKQETVPGTRLGRLLNVRFMPIWFHLQLDKRNKFWGGKFDYGTSEKNALYLICNRNWYVIEISSSCTEGRSRQVPSA